MRGAAAEHQVSCATALAEPDWSWPIGTAAYDRTPGLLLGEVVAGVRSTAVDLVRAAEGAAGAGATVEAVPTEELLTTRRPAVAAA